MAAIFQNQGPIVRQSTRQTAPYLIRDLVPLAEGIANTGRKVHWLNIGDPGRFGFKPPQEVSAAVEEAARARAHTGYAPSQGDPELVKLLAKREGVPESRILVTAGLSEGISFLFRALVDLGEHILLPSPGYPLYNTKLVDESQLPDKASFYQMDRNFQPDFEDIGRKINAKTKAIVVINPNNPTGALYPEGVLRQIVEIAKKARIPIIADEIYDHLALDGQKVANMRTLADGHPLISGNGISKNFFYPGARVGYLAFHGPESEMAPLIAMVNKMANARLSINWEMQVGARAAYSMPEAAFEAYLSPYIDELRLRRDIVHEGLGKVPGITLAKPEATFYAYARVETGKFADDLEFTKALLRETGVFVIPGLGFSLDPQGKGFRLVFLASPEELREAIGKIEGFMKKSG